MVSVPVNVDIITLAMNMYAQGVDPELDFSDMPGTVKNTKNSPA